MNFNTPRAARAFLLIALPLSALAATAQGLRSSVTSFDKQGNPIIQETSGDPNRSSVTSFDKEGNAIITYTSPPVLLKGNNTAPNPNPPLYNRFGYAAPYPNGYNNYNYPPPGYGYPAPGYPAPGYPVPNYGYPAYPVQNNAYTIPLGQQPYSWSGNNSITVVPLTPGYAYPAPYSYPVPAYGYPVPAYNYPVPTGYGNPYGYGYGNGTYSSNSTGYGITFGRGGLSASIGGSNTTSRSSTTITVR